jgi:hypothetical protein
MARAALLSRDEARCRRIVQVEFALRLKGRSDLGLLHLGW